MISQLFQSFCLKSITLFLKQGENHKFFIQSVSQIWTSLTYLNLAMVVCFKAYRPITQQYSGFNLSFNLLSRNLVMIQSFRILTFPLRLAF